MASTERTAYPLGRDFMASIRLYMTHWMWKSQLGYTMSPIIPRDGAESLKVADVACGTAQWLIELSKELPKSAQLDGFDISSKQFPHKTWLPENVRLQELDMLAPLPDEVRGVYDVVHVGLVVTIARDDPGKVLRNLLALLKPGGYLQWDEMDLAGFKIQSPGSNVSDESMTSLNHQVRDKLGLDENAFGWVRHMDDVLQKEGVETLENIYRPVADEIARPWTLAHLISFTELKPLLDGGTAAGEQDFWGRFTKACEEAENGATTRVGMVSTVGRKPR